MPLNNRKILDNIMCKYMHVIYRSRYINNCHEGGAVFVVCVCVQCFCLPFSERGVQGVAGRSQGGTCGTEEEEERSKSIRQQS